MVSMNGGTRGRRRIWIFVLTGILVLHAISRSFAQEVQTFQTIEMEVLNTVSHSDEIDDWNLSGLGRVELDFQSRGSRWVRSRLNIQADIADTGDGTNVRFTIPRAFIRVRFPLGKNYLFRTTFGKSRVTWGDGALYNAGDLVFGAEGTRADLFSYESIRDETDWLVTAFFPLGQFSFIEPVILIPESEIRYNNGTSGESSPLESQIITRAPSFDRIALGSRIQWQLANIKMETGYLFRGADEEHEVSLSMQGNLGPDIYGGVATTIGPDVDDYEKVRITVGGLQQYRYGVGGSVSLRVEALVFPDGEWEELEDAAVADGGSSDHSRRYGLSFFPEIVWNPSESVTLFSRVIVSPIDVSALWIAGSGWNIYEGLTLSAYLSLQSGKKTDTYGFDREGGASLTTSVKYVF